MKKIALLLLALGFLFTNKPVLSAALGEKEVLGNLIYLISQKNSNAKLSYDTHFKNGKYDVDAYEPAGEFPKSDYPLNPLTTAILFGNDEAFDWLLQTANPKATNYLGMTPLHYAALANNVHAAQKLIEEKKVNINAPDKDGYTFAHIVALNGNGSALIYALEHNADFTLKANGKTPIQMVEDFLNKELEKIAARPPTERQRLEFYKTELVKTLNKNQTVDEFYKKINPPAPEPENEGEAVAQFIDLIEQDTATLDDYHRLISNKGYNPNIYLQIKGYPSQGVNILTAAVLSGNRKLVEELLAVPAPEINVNAQNNYAHNRQPIHYAARNGQAIVHALLAKGADVNAQDDQGDTPLHFLIHEYEKAKNVGAENMESLHSAVLGFGLAEAAVDLARPNKKGEIPLTMFDFENLIEKAEKDVGERASAEDKQLLQKYKDKIAAAKAKIAGATPDKPSKKGDDKALIGALNNLQQSLTGLTSRLQ